MARKYRFAWVSVTFFGLEKKVSAVALDFYLENFYLA
jgi:hypothetical protein